MTNLVVDTSAAIAILTQEPGATELAQVLEDATRRVMSAGTYVELSIVLEARAGGAARGIVDRFLREARIEIAAVDRDVADRAVDGWRTYGRGRHPAALNYGDCFTYGLAMSLSSPVLCTGRDFAATDVVTVTPAS